MKWNNVGHEYDELAEQICKDNMKYYIWGMGVLGESFYKDFSRELDILGFIDSNPRKQGERVDGVTVYSPDELVLKENERVLIATGWIKDVSAVLEKKGYRRNVDYFLLDEFSTIYMLYKYDKLYIEKLDMTCNTKCSLRCRHCVGLIPYHKNGRNLSLAEMKRSVDLAFQWVDYMHIFSFGGGRCHAKPGAENVYRLCGEYV